MPTPAARIAKQLSIQRVPYGLALRMGRAAIAEGERGRPFTEAELKAQLNLASDKPLPKLVERHWPFAQQESTKWA